MGRVAGVVLLAFGLAGGGASLAQRFWPHGHLGVMGLLGAGCLLVAASLTTAPPQRSPL